MHYRFNKSSKTEEKINQSPIIAYPLQNSLTNQLKIAPDIISRPFSEKFASKVTFSGFFTKKYYYKNRLYYYENIGNMSWAFY